MEIERVKKELEILENNILNQLRRFEYDTKLVISDVTLLTCEIPAIGGKFFNAVANVKIKVEI